MWFPKTFKNTFVKKMTSYCEHSTMHGVYYLYKSPGRLSKLSWLAILCCCAFLTGYLSYKIWEQYIIDPTVTVVESTHHPTSDVPFPAIVLCDSTMVYGPNTDKVSDILLRRGFDPDTIEMFFETIDNTEELPAPVYDRMKTIHDLLQDVGFPLLALLDELVKPCEVLLVKCIWQSIEYNCSQMFRKVITFKGFCCRFDNDHFRANVMSSTNMSHIDRSKALELVINGKRVFANGTSLDGSAEMFLLDSSDHVTMIDSSVSLAARFFFDVSIELSAMDASDNVKALPRNVRRCTLPTDTEAGSSFYSGCVSEVLLREIVKHCKCLPHPASSSANLQGYVPCSWERIKCISQSRQSFSGSPAELLAFRNCFQKCDYVNYDAKVQFYKLDRPSPNIIESMEEEGCSEISVHFLDRSCIKYKRDVLFTWDQMLANIGGIFGLCMGGSIISIIEIIWLILDLSFLSITDRRGVQQPLLKKKMNDKVFTVTKEKFVNFPMTEKSSTMKMRSGKVYAFRH